ncbi:MAG: hypothetical protein U9Q66_00705 [Patescibacteria group bacterium]|nr:hypothetical protein [Patescibacteria group bacterium]
MILENLFGLINLSGILVGLFVEVTIVTGNEPIHSKVVVNF